MQVPSKHGLIHQCLCVRIKGDVPVFVKMVTVSDFQQVGTTLPLISSFPHIRPRFRAITGPYICMYCKHT